MRKVIKIGRIRIVIPSNIEIISEIDLDQLLKDYHIHGNQPRRNDALLIFKYKDRTFATIIEDTGHPSLNDLNRLHEMPEKLKQRKILKPNMIIMKVLHHKGMGTGLLVHIARSYRIELQECHRSIDLGLILRRRNHVRRK